MFYTVSIIISLLSILSSNCVYCLEESEENAVPPFLRWVTTSDFVRLREILLNIVGRTASSPTSLLMAESLNKLQPHVPKDFPFPCDLQYVKSSKIPSNVNKLRPGDISVIGALGDSLTAGNGATALNLLQVSTQNRGLSWSIGGQGTWREYLTVPNILKEFNKDLVGYSLGDSLSHQWFSQFNPAEIGAMARDMPFMAKELVKRIKQDSRVNLKKHWKLVTILIGSNDYCSDICYKDGRKAAARHKRALLETLDVLMENLPRTLINLVSSPNIAEILPNFKRLPGICGITHITECPCFFGPRFKPKLKYYSSLIKECQEAEMEVAFLPRYQKKDFAVVLQPFTLNLTFPEYADKAGYWSTDISYLSQDCFHFSQKGYARAANSLWNNMMQPVGYKSTNWRKEFEEILCPTREHPYIYTNTNSPS